MITIRYSRQGLGRLYDEISESFTKGGQRTTRQVIAEMAKLPLLYRPGKGWRYGVSADILAAAVEAASGMNYRDFLKQNLLDPLEMVDTDFLCAGSQAWPVCPSV